LKPFTITVLGTSSAVPTAERYLSAHVLNVCEHFFLFDCGEATQIRLRQEKIPLSKIYHIFISHLHGDHFFGLFGLLSSFKINNLMHEVHIYAHKPLKKILYTVIDKNELNFKINFHQLNTSEYEMIYEDKNITIHSFPLKHRIESCAFIVKQKKELLKIKKEKISEYNLSISDIIKIKNGEDYIDSNGKIIPNSVFTYPPEKQRLYAYITDTVYNESILPYIFDADLIYHESTFIEEHKFIAEASGHSTALQAANIAKLANAKKLLLGHFSVRYKDRNVFLQEAQKVFKDTILATEGLRITF
jgi:ribonuclease Z